MLARGDGGVIKFWSEFCLSSAYVSSCVLAPVLEEHHHRYGLLGAGRSAACVGMLRYA